MEDLSKTFGRFSLLIRIIVHAGLNPGVNKEVRAAFAAMGSGDVCSKCRVRQQMSKVTLYDATKRIVGDGGSTKDQNSARLVGAHI